MIENPLGWKETPKIKSCEGPAVFLFNPDFLTVTGTVIGDWLTHGVGSYKVQT